MSSDKVIKTIDQIDVTDNNLMKSIYDEIIQRDGPEVTKRLEKCVLKKVAPILFEAKIYNIYDEYVAITKLIKQRGFSGDYEKGRYQTLEFMLNCIIADPINGDYYEQKNSELIKDAGRLLNNEDAMDDGLVWSFIPKRFQTDINALWGGIGNWQS